MRRRSSEVDDRSEKVIVVISNFNNFELYSFILKRKLHKKPIQLT